MLILSQDNEKVIKRLINFNNIIEIKVMYLSIDDEKCFGIIVETLNNKKKELGIYKTEERAKEVLQEIFKVYRLNKMFECSDRIEQAQTLQAILKENMQPFTYEMPEK